jgi:DNA-binding transcriptional LysR family regulator
LYVTDFGKEIVEAATTILNEVEAINYKTKLYRNQLAGQLRISVVSTGKYVMPYFLTGFMKKHKGVELDMAVTNKQSVIRSLEANKVDFSLVSVVPEQLQLNTLPLLKNKLFLVGGTRLESSGKRFSKKNFESYPLIYREEGSATRNAMESFIASHNIASHKKIELTSNEALKQAVIAGIGYSIMPLIGIKNELKNKDLEIIPFKGLPLSTQWNLIWLKAKKLSPLAEAFLSYIQSEKEQLIKTHFEWYENY